MSLAQVRVFFGSQTGTAERFAEEICEEAANEGITAEVVNLISFTPESFAATPISVLVVSTYGEGEPTENAIEFNKWASDPRNDGILKGRRFCVMGLGDMNYARFNNMGLTTDQNLERLGAVRIYRRGIGDDSQDIEADFVKWKGGGLWESLKKAIADVQKEGPGAFAPVAAGTPGAPMVTAVRMPEVHIFFGQEEADGAAKDICEAVTKRAREEGLDVPNVQSLSDRKAVEVVRKMPRRAVAVVIVDCSSEGLCSAARKLIRNMNLELDSNGLSDKDLKFAQLTVATSKCNNSASSLKEAIQQGAEPMSKAWDRAGVKPFEGLPSYLDAGVEQVEPVVDSFCSGLVKGLKEAQAATPAPTSAATAVAAPVAAAAPAPRTSFVCAGTEAREAAEALLPLWPGGNASAEDAGLAVLAAAAQQRTQVVLTVECAADGGLADSSRGLGAALAAAPIAMQAQLRQLRFALVVVAATDYGNAGERASANAARAELTRAAGPVLQALSKFGAKCVASTSVDLQDAEPAKLTEVCSSLQQGFSAGATDTKAAAPAAPAAVPAASPSGFGTAVLRMASAVQDLPSQAPGEPADVRARFYFEADCAKILRVRELRQAPDPSEGLATAEVEIEAAGALKGYGLGGTLSLLPESDPADVAAMLPLLGITEADLSKFITIVAAEGAGVKVKQPFPTPCTLREGLARFCDLGRAPTKKMLTALLPNLKAGCLPQDVAVKERLQKLLASPEGLEVLQASALCLKMAEFWTLMGVGQGGISLNDFLLHCPRQKVREFTIASSPKASPGSITLCVSMTSQEVKEPGSFLQQLQDLGCVAPGAGLPEGRKRFFGMCSGWLTLRLKSGDKVLAKQRPSPLKLPEKDVPIVMVGSGAGVAPFRGFWEELRRGARNAPVALFFGCRHPDQDWLFKDEMNGAVKLGAGCGALARMQVGPKRPLTCLFTAFSRPGEGKEKKYVQDQIRSQAQSIKHWIENMAGAVYICGSTAMGKGVLEALGEILQGGGETVESLRKDGRIVAEMWG